MWILQELESELGSTKLPLSPFTSRLEENLSCLQCSVWTRPLWVALKEHSEKKKNLGLTEDFDSYLKVSSRRLKKPPLCNTFPFWPKLFAQNGGSQNETGVPFGDTKLFWERHSKVNKCIYFYWCSSGFVFIKHNSFVWIKVKVF